MHILIIDDDPDFAEYLEYQLSQIVEDFVCATVRSYAEALRLLARHDTLPFDFLFLDQHMPGDCGTEVLPLLRKNLKLRQSRAVMLTGDCHDETRANALVAGFDAFLTKPVEMLRLKEIVANRNIYWNLKDLPCNIGLYWNKVAANASDVDCREVAAR